MAGNNNANLVWSIANILRGTYKPAQYGSVVLPFTILRRLDCVLEGTKDAVLAEQEAKKNFNIPLDTFLQKASGHSFFNTSKFSFAKLLDDPANIKANILSYVRGFSENTRDIFERFEFYKTVEKLDSADLLYHVTKAFAGIDLHPEIISNIEMGLMFEELIRRFAEASNETAGEHFTPREVIQLMVQLLLNYDDDVLTKEGIVRSIYDPTAGTGGMLTVAQEHLHALNPSASLVAYGQEINDESYAICKSDLLIKGQDISKISVGDTLANDQNIGQQFDFMLSNPPFGVEWKKIQPQIQKEHELHGFDGRFGPGLPRVSDGSLLFLLHLVRKMRPAQDGGSRIGIVLNDSPLYTGGAGSGESEIRKYLIQNDFVEAIIALPTEMFYNTDISTYIWILSNSKKQKHPERVGKIQLINGVHLFQKMRKGLGSKRKELGVNDIASIVQHYGSFEDDGETSKIFANQEFGYSTITIERPLQLNFSFTSKRIAATLAQNLVGKLSVDDQQLLEKSLCSLAVDCPETFKNREEFVRVLKPALAKVGLKLPAPVLKAVVTGLAVRDESADICMGPKGTPEADTDLRDTENVPLNENIDDYLGREILPHAPGAWIDGSKTKVGYEIPFARKFFEYPVPRSLDAVDENLARLVSDISAMLDGAGAISSRLPYNEYSDSGIPWSPRLPQGWKVRPLFSLVRENKLSNAGGIERNLFSLSYGKIVRKDIFGAEGLLPASFDTYQVVHENDIVLRLTDLQNDKRSLRSAIVRERGIITSAYLAITPHGINPEFLNYLLRAYDLQKVFYSMGGGLRQSLNYGSIKRLPIVIPPVKVQELIVDRLNEETRRIDELVARQEEFLAELKERRSAVISALATGYFIPEDI